MSEAAKEIKFIVQVNGSLKVTVKKPINVGATKHTRHIDARYHFVREYIIDGTIKIIFVTTKANKADIFTKNVTSKIYEEHVGDFLLHREIIQVTSAKLD